MGATRDALIQRTLLGLVQVLPLHMVPLGMFMQLVSLHMQQMLMLSVLLVLLHMAVSLPMLVAMGSMSTRSIKVRSRLHLASKKMMQVLPKLFVQQPKQPRQPRRKRLQQRLLQRLLQRLRLKKRLLNKSLKPSLKPRRLHPF